MKRPIATGAALLVCATLFPLATACGYDEGPPGRVIGKHFESTHTMESYQLTVRTADGEKAELKVSSLDYDNCYRGSAYPACTKRTR